MRAAGIVPDPALSVFLQIDVDKSRCIEMAEFKRVLVAIKAVYSPDEETVAEMMKILDADKSGEIDEAEWCENMDKLPALKAALASGRP